jgi:UDP-N-acetylglucosamine 2-epimerase (non-hydrolysing)
MTRLKLITVVGTRPEIIRLSEIIKLADMIFDNVLVHTGQNYDYELNEIFFKDLELRKPNHFLEVAGNNLGDTMGNIIAKSYDVFLKEKPDALLVLGDTNSVLCTIPAKRLKIPIFHMEAGNRCFDQNVPEEINRRISDHISDINIAYTEHARRYLLSEGFRKDHVFVSGSPLYEVLKKNEKKIAASEILKKLCLIPKKYFIVSTHREENVDSSENLMKLTSSINVIAEHYQIPVIFSTHPRMQKRIDTEKISFHPLVKIMKPFGLFDYLQLQKNALCVLSDSGSVSEEAAMLHFKAVSLRTSTERPEAIDAGTIVLGGITLTQVLNSIEIIMQTHDLNKVKLPDEYLIPDVSKRIIRIIQSYTPIINKVIWGKN